MGTDEQPQLPNTSIAKTIDDRERERRKQFAAAMSRMSLQLRQTDPDKITLAAYWEVLESLPMRAIESACRSLARTATYYPTSADIYKAASESMHAEQQAAMRLRHIPSDHARCRECSDTKWIPMTCSGRKSECGRTRDHLPHDYVTRCTLCATQTTDAPPQPQQNGPRLVHRDEPHWQERNDD